jgi:hypothetical protein
MYTICSLFAICSNPKSTLAFEFLNSFSFDPDASSQNKTPRREGGEAQVMGGFPKEKRSIYTNFVTFAMVLRGSHIVARPRAPVLTKGNRISSIHSAARSSKFEIPPWEYEQATRDATKPSFARSLLACDHRVVMRSPPPHRAAHTASRLINRRAQKISPARAGPSQREETPPVQGHL